MRQVLIVVTLFFLGLGTASAYRGDSILCGNQLKLNNNSGYVINVHVGYLLKHDILLNPHESVQECLWRLHKVQATYFDESTDSFKPIPTCPVTDYYNYNTLVYTFTGEPGLESREPICQMEVESYFAE